MPDFRVLASSDRGVFIGRQLLSFDSQNKFQFGSSGQASPHRTFPLPCQGSSRLFGASWAADGVAILFEIVAPLSDTG